MNDAPGFILFSIGTAICAGSGYFVWFMPKHYLNYIHRRKKRFKSQFSFLPNWFIDYTFLGNRPGVILWWSRIAIIVSLILCLLGIVVSIRGPF